MKAVTIAGVRSGPVFLGLYKFYPDAIVIHANLSQADLDATIDHVYQNRNDWPAFGGRPWDIAGSNAAPSGTYQAPVGFVLHLSDGNPISAQEKLFVLAHNYGWVITFNLS